MTRILAVGLLAATVTGCAVDCSADWHEVGMNEGRIGASSQIERYAAKCPAMNRSRYEEGHAAGIAARPRIPTF